MKISRYIYFPLIFILFYILQSLLMSGSITVNSTLLYAVLGAIVGFVTLFWGDAKARRLTGRNDEEIYKVRQKRAITVLLDYKKAFDLCKAAVNELNPAKIKNENLKSGIIEFRTRIRWYDFGDVITINLKKINENLTEVEISTRPIPRTVLVGDGRSWKHVEDICNYLKEKDAEINKKFLVDSVEILNEVYVKPFQKEKV